METGDPSLNHLDVCAPGSAVAMVDRAVIVIVVVIRRSRLLTNCPNCERCLSEPLRSLCYSAPGMSLQSIDVSY